VKSEKALSALRAQQMPMLPSQDKILSARPDALDQFEAKEDEREEAHRRESAKVGVEVIFFKGEKKTKAKFCCCARSCGGGSMGYVDGRQVSPSSALHCTPLSGAWLIASCLQPQLLSAKLVGGSNGQLFA
jgi:hypothetical protein